MYVYVHICVHVCARMLGVGVVQVSAKAKEVVRSSGVGVKGSYEQPNVTAIRIVLWTSTKPVCIHNH